MKVAIQRHRLLFEIGQVWIAASLANLLFYLFHLVVGRSLDPEDYGLFGALFGIVYLSGALANGVRFSVARFVATSHAGAGMGDAGMVVSSALLQMVVLGSGFVVAFSLASPFIGSYLHSNSTTPILVTGVLIFLFILTPVTQGALQGSQRFAVFASTLLLHAGSRLVFGLAALSMGFGITGVLVAISLSSLLTIAAGLGVIRPPLTISLRGAPVRTFAKVLMPTMIGSLAISFPTAADVVIVRHFFEPQEAGLYTAAAILGRVVLFLPMAVSMVLFPKITRDWTLGNSGRALLYRGLGLTALLSGIVTLGFILFPRIAITTFLGEQYTDGQDLVPTYAAAMFLFSLAVVFLYYNLATAQMAYLYFLLLPHIVLELALLYMFHSSLNQMILVLLSINASLVFSSTVYTMALRPKAPNQAHGAQVSALDASDGFSRSGGE